MQKCKYEEYLVFLDWLYKELHNYYMKHNKEVKPITSPEKYQIKIPINQLTYYHDLKMSV